MVAISGAAEATVNANCEFSGSSTSDYKCTISHLFIDNFDEQVTISGTHLAGYDDSSVVTVSFENTIIFFIPPEFCRKFKNLKNLLAESVNLQKMDLKNCENLEVIDVIGNKIKYLDLNNLSHLKNLKKLDIFWNRQLTTIEGSVNSTAFIERLQFYDCNISSVDPKFLYGFTGRIEYLEFGSNPCISKSYKYVSAVTAFDVREDLQACFQNFIPSNTVPTIATEGTTSIFTTTMNPEEPEIGKMVCRRDGSSKYYNCQTKTVLVVIG